MGVIENDVKIKDILVGGYLIAIAFIKKPTQFFQNIEINLRNEISTLKFDETNLSFQQESVVLIQHTNNKKIPLS